MGHRIAVLAVAWIAAFPGAAAADTVTFESGFVDQQAVSTPIATATNTVTFKVGVPGPASDGFIAAVGVPQTAFFLSDAPAGGNPGQFFLTDEVATGPAPVLELDYFIEFSRPVSDLQLDLYDLELDGNTATLTAFSDVARTIAVGSDSVTIVGTAPEGLVTPLAVLDPNGPIRAASLAISNSIDTGNGIDNVAFTTVPTPVPVLPGPLWPVSALLLAATAALRAPGSSAFRSRGGSA